MDIEKLVKPHIDSDQHSLNQLLFQMVDVVNELSKKVEVLEDKIKDV